LVTERVLTVRELNRATLARQLLLEPADLRLPAAMERLVGLQAQVNNPPYIGLWTRLPAMQRDALTQLMTERRVVRGALMRSTLHLTAADDFVRLWPALQPALARALGSFFGERARGLDIDRLVAAARPALLETPRTMTQIGELLRAIEPARDPAALSYAIRSHLPLVQTPPAGAWRTGGSPTYALADVWLGRPLATPAQSQRLLVRRYLAAFGPATVRDVQTWSGLTNLKPAFAALRPELRVFRDERGQELLDLPDQPLPPADTPAPARFLPEYDNLLLAYADRSRVIADVYRPRVFLSAGRVRATVLVDGMVAGAWRVERVKQTATLVVEPFAPLTDTARADLAREGERLARFIEDDATTVEVQFEGG
jgi:hypothetical protein